MSDLISFIIPTYNRSDTLSAAIRSIQLQTYSNWELIIVDDGSTDETKLVVKKLNETKNITYFYQENKGVSASRNIGAKISKVNYIIFLDSDDTVIPNLVEMLHKISFPEFDLICWEVEKVINGKRIIWKPRKLEKIYNRVTATFLAGSVCYSKILFLNSGGFDESMTFGENYELGIRIAANENLKIYIIPMVLSRYTVNTAMRRSTAIPNRLGSALRLLEKHPTVFANDPVSHARVLYQVGLLYQKKKEWNQALFFYKRTIKTYPFYYKAYIRMGIYFLRGSLHLFKLV